MKIFSIDSRLKTQGTSSDFEVTVQMPHNNSYDRCTILDMELPKTYYTMSASDEGGIIVLETTGSMGYNVVIPGGRNYTAPQLASVLASELTAGSLAFGNGYTYFGTYDNTTGKVFIDSQAGEFALSPIDDQMSKYLGFVGLESSTGGIIISSLIVNVQKTDVINVRSSFGQNDGDQILATLFPNSIADYSMIKYKSQDPKMTSVSLSNNQSGTLRFTLQDAEGNLLDLNGADVRLTFVVYKE